MAIWRFKEAAVAAGGARSPSRCGRMVDGITADNADQRRPANQTQNPRGAKEQSYAHGVNHHYDAVLPCTAWLWRFARLSFVPGGTYWINSHRKPTVETVGYCRASLTGRKRRIGRITGSGRSQIRPFPDQAVQCHWLEQFRSCLL